MSFEKVVATMIMEVEQLRPMTMIMPMITTMAVKETIAVVRLLLP
jgi:hypothetical protein